MADTDTRVDHLLNSVVGCAFVVALDETGLTPDDAADPKVSLRMAAACANFVFRYNSNYDVVAPGILALARGKVDQARALIENPHTAWWFHDVDLDRQAWLSIQGSPDEFIYGIPPNTTAWRHRKTHPEVGSFTHRNPGQPNHIDLVRSIPDIQPSGLRRRYWGPQMSISVGVVGCHFPEDVRVFEIHGPSDWHDLCVQYPSRSTKDNRLVPNWEPYRRSGTAYTLALAGC